MGSLFNQVMRFNMKVIKMLKESKLRKSKRIKLLLLGMHLMMKCFELSVLMALYIKGH